MAGFQTFGCGRFSAFANIAGGVTNTITARLDNAINKLYRNHLNYLKDVLPEMGGSFKLVYSVVSEL